MTGGGVPAGRHPVVAVLGGGQLGRMMALAARRLGVGCRLFAPDADAPAQQVAPLVTAPWDDLGALERFARGATVATWEVEHVPLATAEHLAGLVPVRPAPAALAVLQDRARQKSLLDDLGLPTAPWSAPADPASCRAAAARLGLPLVAKSRRGGYDGRGQLVLRQERDADEAWRRFGAGGLILERFVAFGDECSLLSVRGAEGAIRHWPVVENRHRDGVLAVTLAPHPAWSPALQTRAEALATALLERLDYIGVLAVEMFRCGDRLLVNEVAPRVHNSGHWTIEGAGCCQFENHLRALLGRPLGDTTAQGFAAMVNCLGAMPPASATTGPGVYRHDYGKRPRPGRKVGHLTVVAASAAQRDARLEALRRRLEPAATDAPAIMMEA
jgi:5-(carboxyamino)imidazole ribonucleotide synthase